MKLSKRLRKWRKNITTQTPLDYVLVMHEDIMGFADEVKALERKNAKLRDLIYSILKCADEIDRDRGCDICPMNTDGDLESYLDGTWCKLRPTLREVGFEVGDGHS